MLRVEWSREKISRHLEAFNYPSLSFHFRDVEKFEIPFFHEIVPYDKISIPFLFPFPSLSLPSRRHLSVERIVEKDG